MTALLARQEAFLTAILDEDAALPEGWGARHEAGLEIYRNNYRSALVEALRATYERTERLVGEEPFRQAAAHHCITHPPTSWTLDLAGAGFAETCADLFANDPDVGELAALEWAMGQVFTAADAAPLALDAFAKQSSGFTEEDWAAMRLGFLPGMAVLETGYDLVQLWSALAPDQEPVETVVLDQRQAVIVWREGERPVFVQRAKWEGDALAAMLGGASFGEACAIVVAQLGEDEGAAEAGAMLARWLSDGFVATLVQ
ncbi:HvfC/BufC N-terminal domain-containing protein [Erythrobacter mangrovi]|uniref:Putative DNA-binding domain-containing protein n=1 Tax=Erythrobacter mangrovi TaxID=2739433 RepID=A0A7D4B6S1_9SPHN|nr:DNA-binding domain-containing protein [Erythrobacter mangrovi]QKG70543.1 putative DNA-binding domain-containing protein [Erythrobacter mangrovi]